MSFFLFCIPFLSTFCCVAFSSLVHSFICLLFYYLSFADSQLTSAEPEDEVPSCAPCVAFTHPSSSTTATANSHNNNNNRKLKLRADSSASMDSSSPELDGIASWASARTRQPATAAPHLPSSSSQVCTYRNERQRERERERKRGTLCLIHLFSLILYLSRSLFLSRFFLLSVHSLNFHLVNS